MTIEEIKSTLKKDADNYDNSVWKGMLPNNFIEVMLSIKPIIAPANVTMPYSSLVAVLNKNNEDLTTFDVQYLCNIFAKQRPIDVIDISNFIQNEFMYEEFMFSVADTIVEWNVINKRFEETLLRKQHKLETMLPQAKKSNIISI